MSALLTPEAMGWRIQAYHGTLAPFPAFRRSPAGIHFGTFDQAVHAATLKIARAPLHVFERLQPDDRGWLGTVLLCELKVQRLKRVQDRRTPSAWSRVIKKAIGQGYDGIVYQNDFEGSVRGDSFCIFEPDQVVSMAIQKGYPAGDGEVRVMGSDLVTAGVAA